MTALSQPYMCRLIADALKADGLTQAEFARRTGHTPKHVNRVLTGAVTASVATLDYWAFVLGRKFVISLVEPEVTA